MVKHEKLSAMQWYESEKVGEFKSPIPISVLPNYLGINPCGVDSIQWVKQSEDNQLISLTINFKPSKG
ncbi:hypothetical protein HWC29_gp148 [Aeromonas phage 4_4572]|uniref:Uncharacterized protein n=1 Tax=Aeromonas phage 4_4572 TaxID=2588517 RepID=A0A5B9N4N2_9CAUD|nr:hypothetical protein HWC29_gp148 [Aeromonas phage 4_4572]QEG09038.1 hypothetical protein [Aeromonas phage 4_4572]